MTRDESGLHAKRQADESILDEVHGLMLAELGGIEGLQAHCREHYRRLARTPGMEREAREFLQAIRMSRRCT